MPSAAALVAKLDKSLNKFMPLDSLNAYKRSITRTGGDDLIGRPGSETNTDTLLTPQPLWEALGRKRAVGPHAHVETVIDSNKKRRTLDDYEFLMSPTAMSKDELETANIQIVLKTLDGADYDVLQILDFEETALNGTALMFTVIARSIKRV